MVEMRAVDEIVDFIAQQSPEKVVEFKASESIRERVFGLVDKKKTNSLTVEEKSELEYYLMLEHIMRLAKAKAYKILHS